MNSQKLIWGVFWFCFHFPVLLFSSESVHYSTNLYSFDIITDVKTISMGECGVANFRDGLAFQFNPAILNGVRGAQFYYQHRPMNWASVLNGMYYYALGALMKTPLGRFGIDYTRHEQGASFVITVEDPEGSTDKVKTYDHTFTLGYANEITDRFYWGINLKIFDEQMEFSNKKDIFSSKSAVMTDIGLLYVLKKKGDQQSFYEGYILGCSLQNIGGVHTYAYHGVPWGETKGKAIIPKYFRFGFCYELILQEDKKWIPFQFSWITEYKKYLNPPDFNKKETNYYGIGFEAVLYEWISMRMGGILQPDNSIYGGENRFAFRGGIGIHLPLNHLFLSWPVMIQLDYAYLPIYEHYYLFAKVKRNLNMWGIRFNYVF